MHLAVVTGDVGANFCFTIAFRVVTGRGRGARGIEIRIKIEMKSGIGSGGGEWGGRGEGSGEGGWEGIGEGGWEGGLEGEQGGEVRDGRGWGGGEEEGDREFVTSCGGKRSRM